MVRCPNNQERALVNNRFKSRQPVDWRLNCPYRTLLDFSLCRDAQVMGTRQQPVAECMLSHPYTKRSVWYDVIYMRKQYTMIRTIYVSVCRFSIESYTHVLLLLFLSHSNVCHVILLSGMCCIFRNVFSDSFVHRWSNFLYHSMQQATHILSSIHPFGLAFGSWRALVRVMHSKKNKSGMETIQCDICRGCNDENCDDSLYRLCF